MKNQDFSQNRMPHVYNLIKQYDEREYVPDEIMEIERRLADKNIFNGYSSPVDL